MTDAIVLWDARAKNASLAQFIEELSYELARFSLSFRVVALSNEHAPEDNKIKPSMRALLDLLHLESPYHLITFGSKANSLGTLLSPALKCQLHTNQLPKELESDESISTIGKLTNWLGRHSSWGTTAKRDSYFYVPEHSKAAPGVLYLAEDDFASVIDLQLRAEKATSLAIPMDSFPNLEADILNSFGLLTVSSNFIDEGRFIEIANGYGIPVLLIAPNGQYYGIKEGRNGWVVRSTQQIQYLNCLRNWFHMSKDTRSMISYYCRVNQSSLSGIRHYCSMLGYPERLEQQDFHFRG
ncbi:hypothetical protein ACFQ45_14200 [Rhodanobacter aciditrophus]|uniref:Uncharacterized protein n=1 Tax=Rhodanobacter aciditrophus TaxID=1623218 RepID=A0ABW4B2R6_9GAMM